MSCFVITIKGVAPSTWLLLILEPVTVTFSSVTTPSSDSTGSLESSLSAGSLSSDESSDSGADSTVSSTTSTGSSLTTSSPGLSADNTNEKAKNENKNKFLISLIIKYPRNTTI